MHMPLELPFSEDMAVYAPKQQQTPDEVKKKNDFYQNERKDFETVEIKDTKKR